MNYSTAESPHIKEVTIRVTDLMEARRFYTEVIGLKVLKETKEELQLGVGEHVLLMVRSGAEFKKLSGKAGLYHFALLVPAREDLAGILNHLLNVNAPIQGAADHIFSEAIYLSDPDGNGIEVYCDRPKEKWQTEDDGSLPLASDPLNAEDILKYKNQWEGLPEGTVMGHIHLHVASIPEALHFYHSILNFQVKIRHGNQALFLAAQDYHHHIGLNTWAGAGVPSNPPEAAGLIEYSLQVASAEELARLEKLLQESDYACKRGENYILVKDPSGNQMRFIL
ncbi:VOC family protein [Halobacillus sp. A5]|uniref:VOC family protein n=1 Tax=Halobacillus sp. A5 TaxID=2880263 RepID=UPI0020A65E91|nr:VOC family protein [Halobacillus sp. A5]MCP3028864.1 VOC family protein [Halobacillus sp. A5]